MGEPIRHICYFFIFISILFLTSSFSYGRTSCGNPRTSLQCMVCNCYNEAGNQVQSGQVAVGEVVMSRVGLPQWPNSVCGVVKQRKQFSWYNQRRTRRSVPSNHSCQSSARKSMSFRGCKADHYHATYVRPRWRTRMSRVSKIQSHIFYSKFCNRNSSTAIVQRQNNAAGRNSIFTAARVTSPRISNSPRRTTQRNNGRIYVPRVRTASARESRSLFDWFRNNRAGRVSL